MINIHESYVLFELRNCAVLNIHCISIMHECRFLLFIFTLQIVLKVTKLFTFKVNLQYTYFLFRILLKFNFY